MAILDDARMALRVTSLAYDNEITRLINAAKGDLGIAGVVLPSTMDDLCETAILTYVRMHFGSPADYDKLKASYDEQKAQLQMATGYTEWVEEDEEDGESDAEA